jgi:REP element-mobilizing transposase RayT
MPNHIHGILVVSDASPGSRGRARIFDIVGSFKTKTTNGYIRGVRQSRWPPYRGRLWQRGYYEHVVRNDQDMNDIREYIIGNPQRWAWDKENARAIAP